MRAEEFDKASIRELQALADRCFTMAQSPLEEPRFRFSGTSIPNLLDDAGKLRLLLEAQFYLTAVARRRDEEVANRDRTLEICVIILIGVEILLSILGIWIASREGTQQAKVLANIETSSVAAANAMSSAKSLLEGMLASQGKSLDHLTKMDDNLKASQNVTGEMASAARKQLRILQAEQADRLARLAKKPKFDLYFGTTPMAKVVNGTIRPRSQTDTSMSYDFTLVNEGDAIATRPLFRVTVPKAVTLAPTSQIQKGPVMESPDSPFQSYLFYLDNIRPGNRVPITTTFQYPPDLKSFHVDFTVDSDETGSATPLTGIDFAPFAPQKP